MKHDMSSIALLPTGFVDFMPEEAETEAAAIQRLMDLFSSYGYRRIKPPLLEFEDSLLAPGPGAALAQDTFRLMDPVSHRMMGLRADITPQIARIVCTRLPMGDTPIRLTYANDVLRTKAGQMRNARQFCQVGCEIIRDDGVDSYIEAIMLVILGLKSLGLEGISIDLTLPRLLDEILAQYDLHKNDEFELRQAVEKRDSDKIRGLGQERYNNLLQLLDCIGEADAAIESLDKDLLPQSMTDEYLKLEKVIRQISKITDDLDIQDVSLTFDPFETKGFDYQNGIAFTVFAKGIKAELGRGGFYRVSFGAVDDTPSEKAIGFTLFMDTIRPVLNFGSGGNVLAVPSDMSWSDVEELRNDGWVIVRFFDRQKVPVNCTHILNNGKPEKL